MRKRAGIVVLLSIAMFSVVQNSGFAAVTQSPKPSTTTRPLHSGLTQKQKEAIIAARAAFALAKSNAQNGFDRAIADAQAIRDQAISNAGNNANSIRVAKKSYNDSYKIILRAYKSDLNAAKLVLKATLTSLSTLK